MVARVGRWCYRHTWAVLAFWVVAVVAGALSAGPVFDRLASDRGPSSLESVRAYDVLNASSTRGSTIDVLVRNVDPTSVPLRAALRSAAQDVSRFPGVARVAAPAAVARDGRGVLIQVVMVRGASNAAVDSVVAWLRALGASLATEGMAGGPALVGGDYVLNRQMNQQVQHDLSQAESLSLPVTLALLVVVFGGLVAAGLPVLAAAVSVTSAMAVLLGFSRVTDLDSNAVTVVTLLGLGLSIDYGLLLVARYREELAAGAEPVDAVGRTWGTAGRTIMFSALTVAAALTGLLMFGVASLAAMSAAGVAIALIAMLASLTLTASLLRLVRKRVRRLRHAAWRPPASSAPAPSAPPALPASAASPPPISAPAPPASPAPGPSAPPASTASPPPISAPPVGVGAAGNAPAERGFFARLARAVQRRPIVLATLTAAALIGAGSPALSAVLHLPRADAMPQTMEAVQVSRLLASEYGLAASAVTVVARTDPAALDRWARRWRGQALVARVGPAQQVGPHLSTVDIYVAGDTQGADARALVHRVRADRPPGAQSWVTGDAALLDDLLHLLGERLPWAVGLTLAAMAVLLFAMTGSVVIPIKAVIMNAVSLGATVGVLDMVFERGYLTGPLGLLRVSGIDPFVLVIVFAFAFGLSMDYEVFLLGRIKEYVDRGLSTDQAVRRGLQHSGRVITSAALLMVVVFACFTLAQSGEIQQIGLGLAVAVAIDATIVRCVLVPATMTVLGRWNWWAPRPLARVYARMAPFTGETDTALEPATA